MAATRCTVCQHLQRAAIDLTIAAGVGHRQIAEKYGLGHHAVFRHGRDHLSPEVKAALALKLIQREGDTRAVLLDEGVSVVQALQAVRAPLFGMYLRAVDCNDPANAAKLASRLHESLALSAKLTGQLLPASKTTITNIVISEDYQRLRNELLRALRRHPDAIRDVTAIFRRVGQDAAREMERGLPRPAQTIDDVAHEVADHAA
jgi:hypothetical protein